MKNWLSVILRPNFTYRYIIDIYEIKSNSFVEHLFEKGEMQDLNKFVSYVNKMVKQYGRQPVITSINSKDKRHFIQGKYVDNNVIFEISIKEIKGEPL